MIYEMGGGTNYPNNLGAKLRYIKLIYSEEENHKKLLRDFYVNIFGCKNLNELNGDNRWELICFMLKHLSVGECNE